ncbi:MAG: hypothetical protein V9G12_02825 [Microthrixaceae bacterium]
MRASKAILKEAGYVGAGTCEYLVGPDGDISFLEVNTRLQVEHCVSEEVTGIDLVREQFRIADGEELGYDDPEPHAHSIEFRINGEDAGRNFMPAPGTVTKLVVPEGPGVRWDAGMVEGDTIAGAFDSMVAKLIVTGRTRQQALERSRRVLDELVIEGVATVAPFHRQGGARPRLRPADPNAKFSVHTRWIETEFDNDIPAYAGGSADAPEAEERQTITVEVGGRRLAGLPARGPVLGRRRRGRCGSGEEEGSPPQRCGQGRRRGLR